MILVANILEGAGVVLAMSQMRQLLCRKGRQTVILVYWNLPAKRDAAEFTKNAISIESGQSRRTPLGKGGYHNGRN